MAVTNIFQSDTFDTFRTKTNTISTNLGDISTLLGHDTFNTELITTVVDGLIYTLDRLETENGDVGNLLTTAQTIVGAINEHEVDIGTVANLTTTAVDLVAAINELDSEIGNLSSLDIAGAQESTSDLVGFLNDMDDYFDSRLGDIGDLYTNLDPAPTSLVAAHNELWDREDEKYRNTLVLDLSDSTVTEANYTFNTDGTKNQLGTRQNTEFQEILSNVRIVSGRTLEVDGVLDVTQGTLLVSGGAGSLNITSTFLNLGDEVDGTAINGGLRILRKADNGTARDRVIVYWDESTWKWRVQDLDFSPVATGRLVTTSSGSNAATVNDRASIAVGQYLRDNTHIPDFTYVTAVVPGSGSTGTLTLSQNATSAGTAVSTTFATQITDTPHIVTSRNIGDYVSTGSTQNGISVTYDESANRLNFDVNDFTIELTGDVTGTGTVTNLGNVSIATTVGANKVALGTDTTGAYVASIALYATDPGISLTQSAAGEETNAITALKVDSTVVRTFGSQTINGVKTFGDSQPVFSVGFDSNDDSTIDGDLGITGNVTVDGNLTVSGTVTYVNTETLNIADNIITLNSDFGTNTDYADEAPTENAGFEIERGALSNASLIWNESSDVWQINNGTLTYTLVGSIVLDNAQLSARTITTTSGSKTVTVSSYTNIAVGDNVVSTNIPADTFVTAINGTNNITLSKAATAAGTNTSATFTHAAGLNLTTSGHVTTLEHYTPSSVALDSDNSNGTVLQDISFDQFGHVKSIGTYDLDNRYYTETEADGRFVNVTGDTMTGDLTMQFWGDATTPGFTQNHTGDGSTTKFSLPNYVGTTAGNILSVTIGGTATTQYTISGRFLTFNSAPANSAAIVIKGKAPRLVYGDVVGNAKTSDEALKWSTGRKITLAGDASGDVTIDGTANVTLTVAVADDSHNHTVDNIDDFTENVQDIVGAMVSTPNTEDGITVTYDDTNGKLNFNVNDPTISLTGAVTGSATMTNLGNVSIETTINTVDFETQIKALIPRIYSANGSQIFP